MKDNTPKRKQLPHFSTISDLLEAFRTCKKIVFITGAGVSVSCGIPDFRSKTGIYNTMECEAIGIPSPELLFDLEFFLLDPAPFYKYAHNLLPMNRKPSAAHFFLSMLESKKRLLRNYTQNIDGLEKASGQKRVVECHGSMDMFKCLNCKKKSTLLDMRDAIVEGKVPLCICGGVLKPAITFFGEKCPGSVSKYSADDMKNCDLIVVMGTSLKVGGPVVSLLNQARDEVPQVLINLDPIVPPSMLRSEGFDLSLLGKCDDIVTYISDMLQIKEQPTMSKKKSSLCNFCKGKKYYFKSTCEDIQNPDPDPDVACSSNERRKRKLSLKAREDFSGHLERKLKVPCTNCTNDSDKSCESPVSSISCIRSQNRQYIFSRKDFALGEDTIKTEPGNGIEKEANSCRIDH